MNHDVDRDAAAIAGPASDGQPSRRRRWVPGPAELMFLVVLGLVLVGGRRGLLNDPGTPWHLRLGRDILRTGEVPRADTLTFTRLGTPWVDQSWLFDVLLAVIVDTRGWSAAIGLAALGIAAIYAGLTRGLLRDGHSPLVAVVVTVLATAVGSIHFLIRPHLFTLGFVLLSLRICQRQHERGGWGVMVLPLLTAILANLHGGFLALPLIGLTAALGEAVSGPWDDRRRVQAAKFAAAAVASGLAALANPYGLGLYLHVGSLLFASGLTGLIDEYQPAPFGKPQARVLEWFVLSLVALPAVSARRVDRYQLCHLLVWLHLGLTSIRNAPLFAMAAAPALATLLDGLPISLETSWSGQGRRPVRGWLAASALLVAVGMGATIGGFSPDRWPLEATAVLDRQPTSARLFHEQDWGGWIEAECSPRRRSYLDDRFELYGKDAILEYVDVLAGGPAWDLVSDRDRIDLVWLRPERGLARRLLADPEWTPLHRDAVSVLFARTPRSATSRGGAERVASTRRPQ